MSVLKYIYCSKCYKETLFKYVPKFTLDSSYWECTICHHKIYNWEVNNGY